MGPKTFFWHATVKREYVSTLAHMAHVLNVHEHDLGVPFMMEYVSAVRLARTKRAL